MKLNVNISEKDYLDLNIFISTKSKRGKNQLLLYRIVIFIFVLGGSLFTLANSGFSLNSLTDIIPHGILFVLLQALLKPFVIWCIKGNVKSLEKKGNRLYSKQLKMEFYDDIFVEIAEDCRNELKYSAVQSVSIVKDKAIYIHINDLLSSVIPTSCFESSEQYEELVNLLREKCAVVNEF